MDFLDLVKKRQSDRKYKNTPVDREKIIKCLEAARLAPSACNSQPWKFVVVDDPQLLPEMASAAAGMGMNKFAVQSLRLRTDLRRVRPPSGVEYAERKHSFCKNGSHSLFCGKFRPHEFSAIMRAQ